MKRTAWVFGGLLLCLSLTQPSVAADVENSPTTVLRPLTWYLSTALGVNAPVQDWDPTYFLGCGGNFILGYHLDSDLSLQLSVASFIYTGGSISAYDLRLTPELRWTAPTGGVNPYLLAGAGYDFQFDTPIGYSTASFAAVGGLGFQFNFHRREHAFVEGRYYFLVYQNTLQQDIPILVGLSEDL